MKETNHEMIRRDQAIERAVQMFSDVASEPAQNSMREMLRTIYHGGSVDVCARVDGLEYRWQADWLKYLPKVI